MKCDGCAARRGSSSFTDADRVVGVCGREGGEGIEANRGL